MTILKDKNNKGFLVLTLVLLVCGTVLIIVTGIMLRTVSEVNQTVDSEKALIAWGTVNACGEHALGQMATTQGGLPGWAYTGNEALAVGTETCYIYGVEDGMAGAKLIKASSTVSGFTKKILIEVATNTPTVIVNSWQQVADF